MSEDTFKAECPNERADVFAAFEHCKFLISKGRGTESAKLILPKIEAQRRKANKEGKTRLVKDLHNAQAYADWHKEFDRYVTICVDPNKEFLGQREDIEDSLRMVFTAHRAKQTKSGTTLVPTGEMQALTEKLVGEMGLNVKKLEAP